MGKCKYSIVGVIAGQLFTSNDNTFEEFKAIVDMIYGFGGFVVEFTEEEIMSKKVVLGS